MDGKVVALILHRDGRPAHTLTGISQEEAERWVEAGHHVFVVIADSKRWGVKHVNSGRVMTSEQSNQGADWPAEQIAAALLPAIREK
jgi:hypothetical protein